MDMVTRSAWILLPAIVLAALAALFGPDDRWLGVDIGATGATLFGAALWVGCWLFARHPERIFPVDWSTAERRAWIGLLFLTLVLLNFVRFFWLLQSHGAAPATLADFPARVGFNMFVLLIAWAVVSDAVRQRGAGEVELDERDLRLRHGANRAGDAALSATVVAIVILLVAVPATALGWWLAPLIAANLLIGILIVKSLVEHAWLVASYARQRR